MKHSPRMDRAIRVVWPRGTSALISLCVCMAGSSLAMQPTPETAAQAVERAQKAHGGQWTGGRVKGWTGTGHISILGDPRGPFNFTLLVKGTDMVQRLVNMPDGRMRYGTDHKQSWQAMGPFSAQAVGRVAHFIESQTERSPQRLFDHESRGLTLRDLGTTGQEGTASPSSRIIEAQDAAGKSTRYHISDKSSLIRRVEFDTDAFSTMMLGDERTPVVAAFVFSDYRKITGIMTPFRIEVYLGLIKIEEMTFTSVEYNAGLADDLFVP